MTSRNTAATALCAGLALTLLGATGALAQTGGAPPFEQVMAAPDDIALNLQFAKAEAAAGNLLSADSTLQRVLINAPGFDAARVFRAAVLLRLDDTAGAEQELKLVNDANLTPVQQAEAAELRAQVAARRRAFTFGGQLGLGLVYEEDALGALAVQFDTLAGALSESGTGASVFGRLDGKWKIRPDGGFAAFASLSGQSQSDLDGPDNDINRAELYGGLTGQGRLTSWKGGPVVRRVWLFGDEYLSEIGARASGEWRLTPALTMSASVDFVEQDYDEPGINLAGGDHDGSKMDLFVGLTHRVTARTQLMGGIGYESKEAVYEPFAFDAPRIQAGIVTRFSNGAYLSASGAARFVEYRASDTLFLLGATREDERTNARLAVGAPMGALLSGPATRSVSLEAALTYSERSSVAPLADYDSLGAEMRAVWRFGDQ